MTALVRVGVGRGALWACAAAASGFFAAVNIATHEWWLLLLNVPACISYACKAFES